MKNISKILTIAVAVVCVGILIYLIFFFNVESQFKSEVTTTPQMQYQIVFDEPELHYALGTDFMQGVTAKDDDGNDLTQYVTVSCKPTNDIKRKALTYSINKSGYEIQGFERALIVDDDYKGPSITYNGSGFEIPIDKIGSLSTEIAKNEDVETDDGFGGKCSVSAVINSQDIEIGDYSATVTAHNILGDSASIKISVTVTEASTSIIKLKASSVSLNKGKAFNPMDYLSSAYSDEYGDVSSQVVADNTVDSNTVGVYTVEYSITGIKELQNEKAYLYVTVN